MKHPLRAWLAAFVPPPGHVDRTERLRGSIGAVFGIVLTGLVSYLVLDGQSAAWLIAPMGASSVLLFAVPASPLAQPWSIFGGNVVSALVGVTCAKLVGEPVLAAGLAAGLAIAMMFKLRCLHPPGGAVALSAVLGGPAVQAAGYGFALVPVALNSFLLLACALIYNNATARRYPHAQQPEAQHRHDTADPGPTARLGFTPDDLDAVLQRYNQVIDISRDDLEALFLQTERQAHQRRFGALRCASIMSRDLVTVEFGTPLEDTWRRLHEHALQAVPVVGRGGHLLGMITVADFLRHAGMADAGGLGTRLRALLRRVPRVHSDKPEVAGQIMHAAPARVDESLPIAELVPLMAEHGVRSVPVVDDQGRLTGMIGHSDLIAALYEISLGSLASRPRPTLVVGGRREATVA